MAWPGPSQRMALGIGSIALLVAGITVALSSGGEAPAPPFGGTPLRMTYIDGGRKHPFSQLLERGARDAAGTFGVDLTVTDSNWDPPAILDQARAAIAGGQHAISVLGHPGDADLRPVVAAGIARGVALTCHNVDVPGVRAEFAGDGFGYVGNDQRGAGIALAEGCLRSLRLETGQRAVVFAATRALLSARIQRPRAIVERLRQAGIESEPILIDIPGDLRTEENRVRIHEAATPALAGPGLRLVVCDTPTLGAALAHELRKHPDVGLACFDRIPEIAEEIRSGVIDVVGDQQPLLQGWLPVLQAYLTCNGAFTGLHMDTGIRLLAPSPLPADPAGNPRVVVFTGGDGRDASSRLIAAGARCAGRDLGCDIELVASGWDLDRMLLQVRAAIASRPAAICLPGHPGEEALGSLVDQAVAAGIQVTCLKVDLPNLRARHREQGFGFVGCTPREAGTALGEACAKRLGLPAGARAVVLSAAAGKRSERGAGCVAALIAGGFRAEAVDLPPTSVRGEAYDRVLLDAFLTDLRRDRPDLHLLVVDGAPLLTATLPTVERWRATGPLELAGFDLSPEVAAEMEFGRVSLVADQQAFLHGYLPVVQVSLTRRYGATGLDIDTGAALIDRAHLTRLLPLIRSGIR